VITHCAAALAFALACSSAIHAQQDGLVAFPNNYRVQFENEWVRVVRVTIPGNANLAPHTHPPGYMLHVYLNDAESVVFEHDGSPYTVTRPPVAARSYRMGPATAETHAVINTSAGASDYMRVEFKTTGIDSPRRRVAAPPLVNETRAAVEATYDQFRSTRVTVAAGATFDVTAAAAEPALLIALTDGITFDTVERGGVNLKLGQERFIAAGQRQTVRNAGIAPAQFLRVDFLTRPR
jgi:hypothetical protein